MNISSRGIELIKQFEGFRGESYPDSNNSWSIGYGHNGELNGCEITQGMSITETEATVLLLKDLEHVEKILNNNILVSLTQNQFDALCSLVFNIGAGAFRKSNMLLLLNKKEFYSAADEFLLWDRVGYKKNYLQSRRQKERELFISDIK